MVGGFCAICTLTKLPAKLRIYCHSFSQATSTSDQELNTYHGRGWLSEQTQVRSHSTEDSPLKYLGVLTNLDSCSQTLDHTLRTKIAQCCLVSRAMASGATKDGICTGICFVEV